MILAKYFCNSVFISLLTNFYYSVCNQYDITVVECQTFPDSNVKYFCNSVLLFSLLTNFYYSIWNQYGIIVVKCQDFPGSSFPISRRTDRG